MVRVPHKPAPELGLGWWMCKIRSGGRLLVVIDMCCPNGHVGRLTTFPALEGLPPHKHSISFNGVVSPDVRCVISTCGWEADVIILDDWATPT